MFSTIDYYTQLSAKRNIFFNYFDPPDLRQLKANISHV